MWDETVDLLIFAYSIVSVFLVEEWCKFTNEEEKDKPTKKEFIFSSIALFLFWPIIVICAIVYMFFDKKR